MCHQTFLSKETQYLYSIVAIVETPEKLDAVLTVHTRCSTGKLDTSTASRTKIFLDGPIFPMQGTDIIFQCIISHVVVLCYTGLTLTIRNKDLVVKEGDDLNVVCEPTSETVGLEWVLPEAVSNNADTVVEYSELLRHVLTLRNANIKHSGVYTCGVLGDVNGTIPSDSATVRVRESKIEKELLRLFDIFLLSY